MDQPAHFCENCGSPLGQGASFCEACGAPVTGAVKIPSPPPTPGPSPAHIPPATPPPFYQPAAPPLPTSPPAYYQPAQPSPPAAYYQPPPPPLGYFPPAQSPAPRPRRRTPVWLIVGGVVVGLLVCCGLAVLLGSLVSGASLLRQLPGLNQNLPSGTVVEETPIPQATQVPNILAESTSTSQPAPNEPQTTPALPAPQGQRMEFTDDLSTNDNLWPVDAKNAPPRKGYYPSVYFIDTTKQQGEYLARIPKIDNDQYKVRDFEIEFYGLQQNGDGYLGLDFHYVDDQNYYQVAIKDGKFLIRKKINGQFINLTHGPWVDSNSIDVDGPNQIKVICHSDVMRLEVHGDLMAQLKDDSLPQGDVLLTSGVLPEAPDGATAEARFAGFDVVWWK